MALLKAFRVSMAYAPGLLASTTRLERPMALSRWIEDDDRRNRARGKRKYLDVC